MRAPSLRRAATIAIVVLAGGLLAPPARSAEGPLFRFVSMPDFLNLDIGDVTEASGWSAGDPNSINPAYRAAVDHILDQVAAENPRFVLVAGDAVNGHWYRDALDVRIFGPTRSLKAKRAAVREAGALYYQQWRERFAARGLSVHPLIGDHEIGDNPWRRGWHKTALFRTFKNVWADHVGREYQERPRNSAFTRTAFAFVRHNTMIVGVDEFFRRDGVVHTGVVGGQLTWLRRVLTEARADPAIEHIVVMGHLPVLTPVRSHRSSNLVLEGGPLTEFWQTLVDAGVDLYLAGEVHDMTSIHDRGVEQITHGGYIGGEHHNYLVVDVYEDRLELELKRATVTHGCPCASLWQTARMIPGAIEIGPYLSAGRLVIDKSAGLKLATERTGAFEPYVPVDAEP